MTRPIWRLMNELEMFKSYECTSIDNAKCLEERSVNIPSSPTFRRYKDYEKVTVQLNML